MRFQWEMSDSKEFVQSKWEYTDSACLYASAGGVCVLQHLGNYDSAAEFTRDRMEQIRQLAAEVGFVSGMVHHARQIVENSIGYAPYEPFLVGQTIDLVRWSRTLVRLRDALNELKRGMKL